MQIPVAYSTGIELLFQNKIVYEPVLIMKGRLQCIFWTVLFMPRREASIIVILVYSPQTDQAIYRSLCKLWISSLFPGLFHEVKRILKCIGWVTGCGVYLVCDILPAYYAMM